MCTSLITISTLAFKRTASPHILRYGPACRSSRSQPTTVFLRYRGESEFMLDGDVVILAGGDSTLGSKSFLDKVQIVLPPDPTRSICQALHVTLRVPCFRECIYFQSAPGNTGYLLPFGPFQRIHSTALRSLPRHSYATRNYGRRIEHCKRRRRNLSGRNLDLGRGVHSSEWEYCVWRV